MYLVLKYGCFALFLAAIPLLLVYRAKRTDVPWAFVVVFATVLGWVLCNAAVFFQHAAIDEERVEELACSTNPPTYENKTTTAPDGTVEMTVENPCGIGDWIRDSYRPWAGFIYGPFYLFCCALPYWLLVSRRASQYPRRPMVFVALGVVSAEWVVILGKCTAVFGESFSPESYCPLCNYVDSYTALPLTIALAFLLSWGVLSQVVLRIINIRQAPRA